MKKYYFFILTLLLLITSYNHSLAQTKYDTSFYLIDIKPDFVFDESDKKRVDSLLTIYHKTNDQVLKLGIIKDFSEQLRSEYLWISYNDYLFKITENKNDTLSKQFHATSLNNLGYEYQYLKNDLVGAKKYYSSALEIYKSIGANDGVAGMLNNLAYIYQHEGNIEKCVELYTEAGKLFQALDQPLGLTSIYINLGYIYFNNNDMEKAEDFFKKALVYALKTNQESVIANAYNQLGTIQNNKNNTTEAINYFNKAITIYEKNKNYSRTALISLGLSNVYNKIKDSTQYRKYIFIAYSNAQLSSDLEVKAKVYDHVAFFYLSKKDYPKALIFADSSYSFAKKIAYPQLIFNAAQKLSTIYKQKGNYGLAYNYLNEAFVMKDSLNNDAAKKSIIKSQYKFEYDKKELQLKTEEEKKEILRKTEKQKQQLILVSTIIALLLTFGVLYYVYRNYRVKQKLTISLEEKNKIINSQKNLVEEKQKEILDSINYAKRIQRALLASDTLLKNNLPEHFVLYKPKDIVSGDFYWATKIEKTDKKESKIFILATCDCTGHGVPGAFMSLLNISKLNETVNEKKISQPDLIFNHVREEIISALNSDDTKEKSRDGMDAILCAFDFNNLKLKFAAANNPLIIIRDNSIIEYKADKFPVGAHQGELKPFTLQTAELQKGDCIYTFTDGYADQFGGDRGKKLMSKNFKAFLLSISHKPMDIQQIELENTFTDWRGNMEQVDDLLVIGIRV